MGYKHPALAGESSLDLHAISGIRVIKFTAETRTSGIELPGGKKIRKGAFDAIRLLSKKADHDFPNDTEEQVKTISSNGGTPLVVTEDEAVIGVVELQDIIKPGIHDRSAATRAGP